MQNRYVLYMGDFQETLKICWQNDMEVLVGFTFAAVLCIKIRQMITIKYIPHHRRGKYLIRVDQLYDGGLFTSYSAIVNCSGILGGNLCKNNLVGESLSDSLIYTRGLLEDSKMQTVHSRRISSLSRLPMGHWWTAINREGKKTPQCWGILLSLSLNWSMLAGVDFKLHNEVWRILTLTFKCAHCMVSIFSNWVWLELISTAEVLCVYYLINSFGWLVGRLSCVRWVGDWVGWLV